MKLLRLLLALYLCSLTVAVLSRADATPTPLRPVGDTVGLWSNAAVRLSDRGSHAAALALLDKAVAARQRSGGQRSDTLRYNQALVLARLHRFNAAANLLADLTQFRHAQLNRGVLLCQQGRWADGLRQLEAAPTTPERAADRAYNVAVAASQVRQYDLALRAAEEARRLRPDDPALVLLHGDVLAHLGRHADARRTYESLNHPDEATRARLLVRQGYALLGLKQYAEAARQFDAYVATGRQADPFMAHYGLAHAYYGQRDFGRAAAEFGRAVRLQPKSVVAYTALGHALCGLRHYRTAQKAYENALRLDTTAQAAHLGLGVVTYRLGDVDASLRHFARAESALRADNPDWADSYLHRGLGLARRNDKSAAVASLKTAALLRPHHAAAYAALSELYQRTDYYGSALDYAEKAIRYAPDNDHLLTNRGSLLLKINRMDLAYPNFRAALAKNPRNLNARNGLAVALLEMDRLEHAEALYDSLLAQGHKLTFLRQATLYNNRGIVRAYRALQAERQRDAPTASQRYQQAQRDVETAQRLDTARAFYQNNLGNIAKNTQQFGRALSSYRAYLSKTALNNLAVLYACQQQGHLAKQYLRLAVQHDSSNLAFRYNQFRVFQAFDPDSLVFRPELAEAARQLPAQSISAKYSRDGYINVYLYDVDFDPYEYPADHVFPVEVLTPGETALRLIEDFVRMPDDNVVAPTVGNVVNPAASPAATTLPTPERPVRRQRMPRSPRPNRRLWGSTRCPRLG